MGKIVPVQNTQSIKLNTEQIIQMISQNGLRITEQRKSIARLFTETSNLLSPMQVYYDLGSKHRGLSYNTVYRNLKLLQKMGVLQPFYNEDGLKFGVSSSPSFSSQHQFICMSCDIVYPLDSNFESEIPRLPLEFKVVIHKHEVLGYCPNCSSC